MQGYGHAGSAGIMTSNNHPDDLLLWDAMHNSCFFYAPPWQEHA